MDPEEQIPEDNEQQGGDTSSNAYPGQWSRDKAQKLYSLSQTPKKIKNLKKGVKNAGKMARSGVQSARAAAQAARAAYAAAQATYATVSTIASLLSLKVIIIILIIFLILVTLKIVIGDNSSDLSNAQLTSSGPIQAKIGDKLDYTITVNYPGTAQKIIITDQIPDGTKYVNAPQATYDPVSNTITWNMAAITASASAPNNINATLSLTLLATKDNNYIINTLKGTILGGVLGENDSQILDKSIIPTVFQAAPNEVLRKNDSLPANDRSMSRTQILQKDEWQDQVGYATPTVFQLAPANIPVSPQDTNVIKSCVVTKIGEPVIIPSLPPECTDF